MDERINKIMNNQPENEEYMAKNIESASATANFSSKSQDQSSNQISISPSTSKSVSDVSDGKNPVQLNALQAADISENLLEISQIDKIVNERKESKKAKTLRKLSTEPEVDGPNTEREVVGDDLNKKNEVHILCECAPSVAGAAVPTVISFVNSPSKNNMINGSSSSNMTRNDSIQNAERIPTTNRNKNLAVGKKVVIKDTDNFKLGHENKESEKRKKNLKNGGEENKDYKRMNSSRESNQSLKSVTEKLSTDMRMFPRKPSLIPKLSRANNCSQKSRPLSKDEARKLENMNPYRSKIEASNKLSKSACISDKVKELNTPKNSPKDNQSKLNGMIGNTISSRMLGLQERLKATTSMLRQKIDMDRSSSKLLSEQSISSNLSVEPDTDKLVSVKCKKTVEDLYVNISELKQIASSLTETNPVKNQLKYIEKLHTNIFEIQRIADKLCEYENEQPDTRDNKKSDTSLASENEKPQKASTSTKDNRIYIKFMPTRDKKPDGKKKRKEVFPEQSEEVQTDLALGAKLTSESLNSETCLTEIKDEHKIKETDSMDGVFIPTYEPPMNMEEEDETTGLDITITFPEFNQSQANGTDSHISVCLSEISAEALGKLKRCPKEFTLRMDFVEGKVLFHSGKGPANNFSIGPDLKFTENYIIDDKKSDVINIKPSTECSFTSQLIPVENAKETISSKTLKSTDSELFNVVNLPLLYKSPFLNPATGHKSCINFKNDQFISMAFLARRQIFKSMPQIPSLTNIFEDQMMDSFNKTDSGEEAQKSTKSEKKD